MCVQVFSQRNQIQTLFKWKSQHQFYVCPLNVRNARKITKIFSWIFELWLIGVVATQMNGNKMKGKFWKPNHHVLWRISMVQTKEIEYNLKGFRVQRMNAIFISTYSKQTCRKMRRNDFFCWVANKFKSKKIHCFNNLFLLVLCALYESVFFFLLNSNMPSS